jgi:3-oxoacyl-[acyl-carrier-protein] synthase-1
MNAECSVEAAPNGASVRTWPEQEFLAVTGQSALPVFVRGLGLASALGLDLPGALAALRSATTVPVMTDAVPGFPWPMYALADWSPDDWLGSARHIVGEVAAQCVPATRAAREGILLIASSSHDIGWREQTLDFSDDIQMFADRVGRWLDWCGPVLTVSTACTSSTNALRSASAWLRAGQARSALVLGIELPNRFTLAGFGALQMLALPEAPHTGLVLGQAVAAVYLEAGERAGEQARWRLLGGANIVNGRETAAPDPQLVCAVCRQALRSSGISAEQVDLVKPHFAAGTCGDETEASAMRTVFSCRPGGLPPMLSFKHRIGHTLGAAGAAELALLINSVDAGLTGVMPAPRYALLCSLGFGGGYAALVLERRL